MKNDHSFYTAGGGVAVALPAAARDRRPVIASAVLALLVTLAVLSFTWPAANLQPRDLPLAVVGAASVPAGVDARSFPDESAAIAAIRDREVYGAIVEGRLLVASAASPAVAQRLRQAAGPLPVRDVAPEPANAPLAALVLPLTLIGMVTGILGVFMFAGRRRLAWLIGASAAAGLLAMAALQGSFGGPWLAEAGVLALAVLAVSATVTGLVSLIGKPGIGVAALTMVLVGNPWSGVTSAPELLPEPAGTIGQLLPPGAAGTLLRNVAYFDGAAAIGPLTVLLVWAVAGLTAVAMRARRAS